LIFFIKFLEAEQQISSKHYDDVNYTNKINHPYSQLQFWWKNLDPIQEINEKKGQKCIIF